MNHRFFAFCWGKSRKTIKCFILVKSHQELKYSVIKGVKLLLVLSIHSAKVLIGQMKFQYFSKAK